MSTRRRVSLWLLALVLLLAQQLGQVHRALHGPVLLARAAVGVAASEAPAPGWEAKLFASHLSDSDCRLYDQLAHSDLLPTWPVVLPPLVAPAAVQWCLDIQSVAGRTASFDARGPPRAR